MTSQNKHHNKDSLFTILIVITLIFFPYKILDGKGFFGFILDTSEYDKLGQFISGITAPLAILLLYWTYKSQKEELRESKVILKNQSTTLKTQQFESTYFNSINLLNDIIKNISYVTLLETIHGRSCFAYFYDELKREYNILIAQYITKNPLQIYVEREGFNISQEKEREILTKAYEIFFERHQSDLGHYFRTLYNIIKFVNQQKPENPKYYTNLLRAQLSTYEHLLLFYNCFSEHGDEKFMPLVIEYSLLDNMPTSNLLDISHKSFYPENAYQ